MSVAGSPAWALARSTRAATLDAAVRDNGRMSDRYVKLLLYGIQHAKWIDYTRAHSGALTNGRERAIARVWVSDAGLGSATPGRLRDIWGDNMKCMSYKYYDINNLHSYCGGGRGRPTKTLPLPTDRWNGGLLLGH